MIKRVMETYKDEDILKMLNIYVSKWFRETFKTFTPPQRYAIPQIERGRNVVVTAPTGTGKTLSAFLSILSRLFNLAMRKKLKDSIYCIYISPLRALDRDIYLNLLTPLREIKKLIETDGKQAQEIRVSLRTGDVLPSEKQKQLKYPPHILVSTPESLAIMLNSPKFSQFLKTTRFIVVDEIHELVNNKRGVLLSLAIERLVENIKRKVVRIGLGATLHPLEEAAKFLVGYDNRGRLRDCVIVDVTWEKPMDLKVICPVKDIVRASADECNAALYKTLDELIKTHTTTLVFTNTRSGTERVVHSLKEKYKYTDEEIAAHHGSLSREIRLEVEDRLKKGLLKGVICVSKNSFVLSNPCWNEITNITPEREIIYLDEDFKLKRGKFDSLFSTNYGDYGLKIKSRLGYEIECTKEHKFLTIKNSMPTWVEAKDLKVGDRVGVIRKIPSFTQRIPLYSEIIGENAYVWMDKGTLEKIKELIKVKFGSIKNLCKILNLNSSTIVSNLNGKYPIKFGNLLKILDELEKKELIKQVKIIRTDKKKHPLINAPVSKEFFRFLGFYLAEGSWDTSGISIAGEKYLLEFYSKLLKKDFPLEPIVTKNSYGVPVFKFSSILLRGIIEKLLGGLRKKSIKGKFPNILYELPEEYKWCFLSGYLDGDGYPEIKNGKVYSLGFVTFNQNFANGLRSLLLQLGIVASIRKRRYEKEQDFRGRKIRKSGICYTISIYGGNHLRNFSKFIQPKRKSLQFAFNSLRKTDGYCNRDVIPNIGELLKVVRKRVGLSTYELQKIGYNPEKVEIGSRNITRKNLQQLIELYSKFSEVPELLKNLANSDIFWDKITKIEKVYIDKIYSLVNTTNHNYVINGFICQNSSTSLELGIDIGYIDLVAQIGSPKSVTRAVQRIGRSGHGFYDTAVGRIIVLDRDDLVECSVMLKAAKERLLDRFDVVKNALDILAQHVVGMALNKKWKVEEALKVIRRSYCYHELDKKQFIQLLHYLAGHYASLEDRAVYGKIWFDEKDGVFGRRGKYTRIIYFLNLGAIPDEVSIDVYTYDGWYVGNIEEDFLARLRKGDIFILGGKPYRFRFARGLRCYVDPMPHETNPTIPNWFSELLPLSYDLALEIQKFREKMKEFLIKKVERKKVVEWLLKNLPIDENSANSIYSYFLEQWFYVHEIPGREILVEKTFDLEGRKYVVFHSLFGRRINDALSRAVAILASDRIKANVGVSVSDNGFALLIPREKDLDIEKLFKELVNCNLIELLENNIRRTELMKRRFRHCASRSFLVLRNYKGYKISVAKQQRNSEILLRVCEKISKDFPVIKETYREILNDTMDLKRTEEIISKLKNGKLKYKVIETELPSPFAHGLIVLGEADIITMKDRKKRLLELYEATMKRILKAE